MFLRPSSCDEICQFDGDVFCLFDPFGVKVVTSDGFDGSLSKKSLGIPGSHSKKLVCVVMSL
jgi:hypothetical protein